MTSLGIDNTGKLILTYGQEDVDKDASGAYIYRAAESNFFCRIRDLFADRLKGMFQSRESLGAWSSTSLINQWDKAQSEFPEELWRLDVERKYIRTYRGISIDNSIAGAQNPMFLEPMLNGRKKYQRRQFERNQELYMATKYVSTFAKDDFIRLRFNNPTDPVVKQDYTLYLTPYTDMYIAAEFGNTDPIVFRAKAGVEYPVRRETASDTADIVLIYGASFIQAIGDLSKCYLGDNDFSKASRLQSLVIGSDVDGYENTFMTGLALGNNKLLEYLDIRNITGLNSVVDLSNCNNLVELRAEGSGATGVIFANGGKVQEAYIPAVTSLTMKNLNDLEVLDVASYDNLQRLVIENIHSIDTHAIVDASTILNTIRLVGIDWNEDFNIQDTSILSRMYTMRGVDNDGYETSKSVVTGYIWVAAGKDREIGDFNALWPYLTIEADAVTPQFKVTFVNDDGTVLDTQYVDADSLPVDPITREEDPIETPTKASTVSTNYEFAGWDTEFTTVWSDQIIKATYKETIREYTIKYMSNGTVLQTSTAPYGSIVSYTGDMPTYTAGENSGKYCLFDGWDQVGYVDGDKTIKAVFDECTYKAGYFDPLKDETEGTDLSSLRPVELYMMIQLGKKGTISLQDYINPKDSLSIQFGNDFDYENFESKEIVLNSKFVDTGADTIFDGTNYIDTGLKLFESAQDFVLAIDYEMATGNTAGAVLAECFDSFNSSGFKLSYDGGERVVWGDSSVTPHRMTNYRQMLILRYVHNQNKLYVYTSNISDDSIYRGEIDGIHSMEHTFPLMFGCSKINDNAYMHKAKGTIHWCKIWYGDLGEDICSQLAIWPHEQMSFEMCYNQTGAPLFYYLKDGSITSMALVSATTLSHPMSMHMSNDNTGGWPAYQLNAYLNNRILSAFPDQWKQLIKQVRVKSTSGNESTETVSSYCHIFVPSLYELGVTYNGDAYKAEAENGQYISHLVMQSARGCKTPSGKEVRYWTRSPSFGYSKRYVWSINEDGSAAQVTALNNSSEVYVRFIITM